LFTGVTAFVTEIQQGIPYSTIIDALPQAGIITLFGCCSLCVVRRAAGRIFLISVRSGPMRESNEKNIIHLDNLLDSEILFEPRPLLDSLEPLDLEDLLDE
jgi:hypothetical protein